MEKKKTLGFICPLNEENSETRRRSDDITCNILEPIAEELGYTLQRADQLQGSDIMQDIIKMLHDADIIIADLTEMNPNVFLMFKLIILIYLFILIYLLAAS